MVLNDAHHHIALSATTFGEEYTFSAFLRERAKAEGDTIVFILPNRKALYPCHQSHHYRVVPSSTVSGGLKFECLTCGNVSYEGQDPYRRENEQLISLCKGNEKIHPYIYLSLCDSTINDEFQYYCSRFKGAFRGIKVHPNLCCKRISEVDFNSGYPIVIHAGMQPEDDPEDIIRFAERYDGNVLIAHMARCKIDVLRRVKELPNVFIDTSPTYLVSQICRRVANRYYESPLFDLTSPTDVFLQLVDLVGLDKIVFGSDAPFGAMDESIALYNNLDLPPEYKKAIFEDNFHRFNRIVNGNLIPAKCSRPR